ncbi:nucleotide exchange factor GrpE [Propionibacteriaceae bacterium Y1923]
MSNQTFPEGRAPEDLTPDAEVSTEEPAAGPVIDAEAPEAPAEASPEDRIAELESQLAERTTDLQRLGAEYVNYKKRVDRDRDQARQAGVESVVQDLLPVLDSIALARQHDDITQGFQMVADELSRVTSKHGLVSFGEVGEAFDPNFHEALMQAPLADGSEVDETTISQVIQTGYRLNDRVVRPARVAVANPA